MSFNKPIIPQLRHLLSTRLAFVLMIVTFVIFSSGYSLITPIFEAPDEEAHAWFAAVVYTEKTVHPYIAEQPLYYFIVGAIYEAVPPNPKEALNDNLVVDTSYPLVDKTRFHHGPNDVFPFKGTPFTVHILRLFSIFCGVITIIYVYKIAKVIFAPNKWLPLFPAGFVSLIPTFIWINSILNNDVLVWTLSTIAIYYLIKFVTWNYKLRFLIMSSIFTGLAISTKENGNILYPILLVVLSYLLFTRQVSIKHYFRNIAIFVPVSMLSGGWYIPLNIINAIGLDGLNTHKVIQAGLSESILGSVLSNGISEGIGRLTNPEFLHNRLIDFTISGMGQNVIWISKNYSFFYDALLMVAIVGLVITFAKMKSLDGIKLQNNHLIILFSGPILILSIMGYHWLYDEPGLTRYTFPVVACFGMLFSIGFYRCVSFKKYLKVLVFIPLIFFAISNLADISAIRTGLGVNTLTTDSDSDGISDDIDTQPHTFSNSFDDHNIGGTSSGYIVNRDVVPEHLTLENYMRHVFNQTFGNHFLKAGEQTLHIEEDPNHQGIHISDEFTGGEEPAQVSICNKISTLYLHPSDDVVFLCDKNGETIRVAANSAMTTFMDGNGFLANSTIPQGNGLSFNPSTHTFIALDTNNEKITINYNGAETILEPGKSKIVGNVS